MDKPLVSVIVPNYNYARYLDERIETILNQTYRNFELIILDDKSTDNSEEVIEKYRTNEHVSHIVINDNNSGCVFRQWEKGISLAKGELVWIAESDDSCDNSLLEKLVNEFVKDDNCVLAFARSLFVDDQKKPLFEHRKFEGIEHWNGIMFIKKQLSMYNIVSNASSAVFKREVAMKIDKQYMTYKGAGDLLFWIEICENGNVAIVNEYLNYFRQHTGSTTVKCNKSGDNIRELKRINNYLKGKGILSAKEQLKAVLTATIWIIYGDFEDKELKKELLQLWAPKRITRILARILYHVRKIRNS